MVMMQSPKSDSGPSSPASPTKELKFNPPTAVINSDSPDSRLQESDQDKDFDPIKVHQVNPSGPNHKFLTSPPVNNNKENTTIRAIAPTSLPILGDPHHHIIYPRTADLIEPSAKFSIERLKQLADHNITRLSPTREPSQEGKYSIDHTIVTPVAKYKHMDESGDNHHHHPSVPGNPPLPLLPNGVVPALNGSTIISPVTTTTGPVPNPTVPGVVAPSGPPSMTPFGLKYLASHPEFDLERFKFARAMSNGKDLSDFGFRIQLGVLQSNYARSDTSEELNVDGNDDSSQDGNSVGGIFLFLNETLFD